MILLVATALAQDLPAVDAQNFDPTIDPTWTLWTDETIVDEALGGSGKVLFQYLDSPLVYDYDDGERVELVESLVQMDVLGSVGVNKLRLGLDVPVMLTGTSATNAAPTGLGDVALELKGMLVDRELAPAGVGLLARAELPTASSELPVGNDGLGWEVQAMLDTRQGPVVVAANLGTRGVPTTELETFTYDDQFFYRAGLGVSPKDRVGASLDLAGSAVYGEPLEAAGTTPLEALLGGWWRLDSDVVLRGGVGRGLTSGIGSPELRVVFGMGWEPHLEGDNDRDGLVNRMDQCRTEAEDVDGYRDDDGCPDPAARVLVRLLGPDNEPIEGVKSEIYTPGGVVEGTSEVSFDAHPGSYRFTGWAMGYQDLDTMIEIPEDVGADARFNLKLAALPAEIRIAVSDDNGNPVSGHWWVGDFEQRAFDGGQDSALVPPGTYTVSVRVPDHAPVDAEITLGADDAQRVEFRMKPSKIEVTREQIKLREKVYFELGSAVVLEESWSMLSEVAIVLRSHKEITKVRVEGHTDSQGGDAYNLKLSDERAASVRQFLVDRGVEGERLDSVGYGEGRPLASNDTEQGREKNRRVEIFIEERSDGAPTEEAEATEAASPARKAAPVEDAAAE